VHCDKVGFHTKLFRQTQPLLFTVPVEKTKPIQLRHPGAELIVTEKVELQIQEPVEDTGSQYH
jgi:hypothetical protein